METGSTSPSKGAVRWACEVSAAEAAVAAPEEAGSLARDLGGYDWAVMAATGSAATTAGAETAGSVGVAFTMAPVGTGAAVTAAEGTVPAAALVAFEAEALSGGAEKCAAIFVFVTAGFPFHCRRVVFKGVEERIKIAKKTREGEKSKG